MSDEAMETMKRWRWPGNIRELQNCIERALILCDAPEIKPEHLHLSAVAIRQKGSQPDIDLMIPLAEALQTSSRDLERAYVNEALRQSDGDRARGAKLLGMTLKSLAAKIRDLGLTPGPPR